MTKAFVRDAVEGYWEVLEEEITSGGKVQVSREEGKSYVTSIAPGGQCVRRPVRLRLRTKIHLYKKFK